MAVKNVRAVADRNDVFISWKHDESGPPLNFELEAQLDTGVWYPLGKILYDPGVTEYEHNPENPVSSSVRYRVRAANEIGSSAWVESNQVLLIVGAPNAPTDLQAG